MASSPLSADAALALVAAVDDALAALLQQSGAADGAADADSAAQPGRAIASAAEQLTAYFERCVRAEGAWYRQSRHEGKRIRNRQTKP